MNRPTRFVVGVLTLLSVSVLGATVIPTVRPGIKGIACGGRVQALCQEAAQIDDKAQRDAALSALFERWLESDDHEVRVETFKYLENIWRFYDPRGLRSTIERYDVLEGTTEGEAMLARAEFSHAPRDVRLQVYRQAIIDGEAPIGAGELILRVNAMMNASLEGLNELRDLIREYYPKLGEDQRLSGPLDQLIANLDLRAGADNREGADALAAHHLATMPPAELWSKCEASEGWRRAVASTARDLERNFPESAEFKEVQKAVAALRNEHQASLSQRAVALGPGKAGARRQRSQHEQELMDWFKELP